LHRCRIGDGRRAAGWRLTFDKRVQHYAIEQEIKQLDEINANLEEYGGMA
jgi:hypothetical protein